MSRSAAASTRTAPRSQRSLARLDAYFQRSERPLHSLVFVLPLIVTYQLCATYGPSELVAFQLLDHFFQFFGASGRFLPPLAVVGILLTWHVASSDRWEIHLGTLAGMFLESVFLTIPILVLAVAVSRFQVRMPLIAINREEWNKLVISMGAGVYEELVFRLIALTTLHLLLVDILKMPQQRAMLLMVAASATLFSLYHYLGNEAFSWKTCVFRTIAGIYFATLFLCRGFGVTAGCHFAYDAIIAAFAIQA